MKTASIYKVYFTLCIISLSINDPLLAFPFCNSVIKYYNNLSCNDSVVNKTVYFKGNNRTILTAINGVKYDWQPKTGLSSYNIRQPVMVGFNAQYTAYITEQDGCIITERFTIVANCDSIIPLKTITVLDTTFEKQEEITLVPQEGIVEGTWEPSKYLSCTQCQTPVANPINSTIYSIKLTDDFKCTHQENFKINIALFIPNVITPNGDNLNDVFKITGLPDNTTLKIFDKNGNMVFSANPYNDSDWWNGDNQNGVPLETGTYWYVLYNSDHVLMKKGFIYLKR